MPALKMSSVSYHKNKWDWNQIYICLYRNWLVLPYSCFCRETKNTISQRYLLNKQIRTWVAMVFNKPTMNNANSLENNFRSFFIVIVKCSKLQLDTEPRRSKRAVPTIGYTDNRGKDPFLPFIEFWVSHLLHSFDRLWNPTKPISPISVHIAFPVKQSKLALNKMDSCAYCCSACTECLLSQTTLAQLTWMEDVATHVERELNNQSEQNGEKCYASEHFPKIRR